MSADELNPAPLSEPREWEPPSGSPVPPEGGFSAANDSRHARLTGVPWSVAAAFWIVGGFTVTLVLAALAAAAAIGAGIGGAWATLVSGLILSSAYLIGAAGVWYAARARGVSLGEAVGLRLAGSLHLLGVALAAAVLGRVLAATWGMLLQAFDVDLSGLDLDPTKLFGPGAAGTVMLVLVAVVLAPVTEEIIFRGVLLSALEGKWGVSTAIIGSSLAFSLVHLSLVAIPAVFMFALVLGWLFVRTRSLAACIAAHSLFNGLGLAAVYALKALGAA